MDDGEIEGQGQQADRPIDGSHHGIQQSFLADPVPAQATRPFSSQFFMSPIPFSLLTIFATLVVVTTAGTLPCSAAEPAPTGFPPRDGMRTRRAVEPPPTPGAVFHLSPVGDDMAPGTQAKPFATLERCRDEIRAMKKKGPLPAGGILIQIHGGDYFRTSTFSLDREDSGTAEAPIRYATAPGAKPVFTGGKRVDGWRPLADSDDYPLLPPGARANVRIADFPAGGSAGILPLKLGGFGSGNGFITHPAHELYFNGRAMSLSRGPNEGVLRIKEVAVPDGTKGYDRQGSMTGSFFYEGDRPRRWVNEPDLLLYGYWFWDWADSYERVASIDPDRRLINLAKPGHSYGYSVGAPFYAVNALSELDAPGEWFLDRARKTMLFIPPTDHRNATIELSLTAETMVQMDDVSHHRFEGITWDMGAATAIRINNGNHCVLAGCTVKRFAGNGVEINGGRHNGLLSCDIFSLGRGGVKLSGGDRRTLEPGASFVENCDIHGVGRIDHTYTPAIQISGVGNRIAHNRLHDIPSSAMRIEGNDMEIEYNEIYNVVTESDDQGGADMWGDPTFLGNRYRFNYWHHIGNWRNSEAKPKCGHAGIRLDDAISGTLIYGNIFERCASGGFGAVQIHGGTLNDIVNNLFIDCAGAVSIQSWELQRWRDHAAPRLLDSRGKLDMALYERRYPELSTLLDTPNANRIRANATLRVGKLLLKSPATTEATDNDSVLDDAFSMKTAPPILTLPGLEDLPLGEIGLYTDAWRPVPRK